MSLFFASLLVLAQATAPQPPAPQIPAPRNASPAAPQNASPAAPQNASPAAPQNVSPSTPQNTSAPKPLVEPPPDPASSQFLTEAGMILVAVKPAAIADYDLVIQTLQEALAKDTDPVRVAAAKGWRVFKGDADAKGNQIYVHLLLPVVPLFDYRPSLLVDELVEDLAPQLLSRYQEAFAAPPMKLSLAEFANMSVAPLPVTPPTPTPPVTKKPPGG